MSMQRLTLIASDPLKLVTALAALALPCSLAQTAAAADGCVLNDLAGNQGSAVSALLSDDVTVFADGDHEFGKTGFSTPTASGFGGTQPAQASSVFINAGLSDIGVQLFVSEKDDVRDNTLDYGGDGTNFQGGVFVTYCPKGKGCSFDLPAKFSNKNQAWECMRQFNRNTPIVVALQKTSTSNANGPLPDILTRWQNEVTKRITSDSGISNVTGARARVSIEPFGSYCRRTKTNCGTDTAQAMWDMIRLHWEGTIDPKVTAGSSKACTWEAVAECGFFFPFCPPIFDSATPVCDAAVGTKHVVIDTWIRAIVEDRSTQDVANPASDGPPFRFVRGSTRVSVESGTGSSQIQSKIAAAVKNTPVEQLLTMGILSGIGEGVCKQLCGCQVSSGGRLTNCATNGACADCTTNTTKVGAVVVGQDHDPNTPGWPQRVALDYYVGWDEPDTQFFSSTGEQAGAGVEIFTVNLSRTAD